MYSRDPRILTPAQVTTRRGSVHRLVVVALFFADNLATNSFVRGVGEAFCEEAMPMDSA